MNHVVKLSNSNAQFVFEVTLCAMATKKGELRMDKDKIFKEIAAQHGVSVDKVIREMQDLLNATWNTIGVSCRGGNLPPAPFSQRNITQFVGRDALGAPWINHPAQMMPLPVSSQTQEKRTLRKCIVSVSMFQSL